MKLHRILNFTSFKPNIMTLTIILGGRQNCTYIVNEILSIKIFKDTIGEKFRIKCNLDWGKNLGLNVKVRGCFQKRKKSVGDKKYVGSGYEKGWKILRSAQAADTLATPLYCKVNSYKIS